MNTTTEPGRHSILGAGPVGKAIGRHWIRARHDVTFGVRDPDKLRSFVDTLGPRAHVATLAQAATSGDIVLLALAYTGVEMVFDTLQARLAHKIVIDASNPVELAADGRFRSTLPADVAAGHRTASRLPTSRIVRAFSHVTSESLDHRGTAQPHLWAIAIAGDDTTAKPIAAQLVRDTGFVPVDIGGLAESHPLDPGGPLFARLVTEPELRDLLRLDDGGTQSTAKPSG